MTLFRTIVILLGGLALLLSVVILRAETARLSYQIARLEREAGDCHEQTQAAEVELARLRSPIFLRQRIEEAVRELGATGAAEPHAR